MKNRKIKIWLLTLTISFGITSMVALAAPKYNYQHKAIKYNLPCLVEEVEDPLRECQMENFKVIPSNSYYA